MSEFVFSMSAVPSEDGFDILAISEGEAKGHGIRFSSRVLREALPLYDEQPVFIDHPAPMQGRSVRNLAGALYGPTWDEAERGIRLKLRPAGPSADVLLAVRDAAKTQPAVMRAVGFSTVLRVTLDKSGDVTKIVNVKSVDVVIDPARGGKFLSAQSVDAQKGETMSEEENGVENADPKLARIEENRQAAASLLGEQARLQAIETQLAESDRLLVAQCEHLLTTGLSTSRLPDVVQARLRKQFEGRKFQPTELQTAIDEARDEVSALTAGGIVSGPGRVSGMFSGAEQFRLAVEDLLGIDRDPAEAGVKVHRLSGIREAYILGTGDRDLLGTYAPEFALGAATDFTVVIKNALNKRLVASWAKLEKTYGWWKKIVTVEHFNNLLDVDWMIFGTIGSLPTVTKGGDYQELPIGDNGESSSWSKYGGYVGIYLEDIINDNVRAFRRLPDEIAMGGIRNISEQVAAIFTVNSGAGPTLADGGALFNATAVTTAGGHKNLLTTALGTDLTAWRAVETAMFKQPMLVKNKSGSYGVGKPQGIKPKYCLVPQDLYGSAADIFLKDWNAAGPNMGYGVEPVVVPEWTDATDWAAVADPDLLPGIMLGEIFGVIPQIVISGGEKDPAFFANDEARYKVRQFLTVGVSNWRALHKSNVAG